jgi:hypothetical protein
VSVFNPVIPTAVPAPESFRVSSKALRAAFLYLLVGLSACRTQAERELGREVTAMAHLVNQVRDVKNPKQRAPALATLRDAACTAPEVCQLQQACLQPYQLEAHALGLSEQVSQALEQNSELPQDLARKGAALELIQSSERELKGAHDMMLVCLRLQTELEERYVAKR